MQWVSFRVNVFRSKLNPPPSRHTHRTWLHLLWTNWRLRISIQIEGKIYNLRLRSRNLYHSFNLNPIHIVPIYFPIRCLIYIVPIYFTIYFPIRCLIYIVPIYFPIYFPIRYLIYNVPIYFPSYFPIRYSTSCILCRFISLSGASSWDTTNVKNILDVKGVHRISCKISKFNQIWSNLHFENCILFSNTN